MSGKSHLFTIVSHNFFDITNYIKIKGKENEKFQMMEYLFSNEGKFEDKATIIIKNTDNLEY